MDDAQYAAWAAQQGQGPGAGAYPAPAPAWSADQLVRLEYDWRQLQRNFAYHPTVQVAPLRGNPPFEYQVQFTARTLYIRDDGQLDYLTHPAVHIWLPPGYPHEAPVVRPMQPVFHPNVVPDGVALNPAWEPTRTLADLVQQLGAMLAFQAYDPWTVWNPAAMDWVNANVAYLPTDPAANFSPEAGGAPLGRLCNNGARTVEQMRGQLRELCASMLSLDDPPGADEVRSFAENVRLALNLFLEDDVPDSLRAPATELDEWASALPGQVMLFEGLRQRHLAAVAALQSAGKLAEGRRVLNKEIQSFEQMVIDLPAADPEAALAQLPDLPHMQAVLTNLRVVAGEAEKRLAAARHRLAALTPPPPRANITASELMEKTIEAEMVRATAAVNDARDKTRAAIDTITPTVERVRDELAVFDRVAGWKEFAGLSAKARELVDRVRSWASAGVQAYFVENEGGVFGPFEFERRLDLGASALAVRNTGRTSIEVFDVPTGRRLAQTDAATATVPLPAGEAGEGGGAGAAYATTFRMTARCDDLWVQLEYLTRQIGEALNRLVRPLTVPRAESWAASFDAVLSAPDALKGFVEAARRDARQRIALVADLKALSRFKERLATQFLIERHAELIADLKARKAEAQATQKAANQKIAEIFSRSQRDPEGAPMIPPKFAKDFELNRRLQDESAATIEFVDRMFALAVTQIKPRLLTPALYGSEEVPAPQVLEPLPPALRDRAEVVSEPALAQQIAYVEQELGVQLRPDAPAGQVAPVAARPATIPAPATVDGQAGAEQADAAGEVTPADVQSPDGAEEDAAPAEAADDYVDFGNGHGTDKTAR